MHVSFSLIYQQTAEVIAQLKVKVYAHKRILIFRKELTLYCIIFGFLALVSALKNASYRSRYFFYLQEYFAEVAW